MSNFFPVKIIESYSPENPLLQLYLFRGQWQLATQDAIYSDGLRYRPLLLAFQKIEKNLKAINKVLVLGAGLGSAAKILNSMNFFPTITLVDIDAKVLEWAKELMTPKERGDIHYHLSDAFEYINNTTEKYDLITADIFKGRVMPEFLTNYDFLNGCKTKLTTDGIFIVNYMISDKKKWEAFQKTFIEIFPKYDVIKIGINRVIIATKA